MHVLIKLELNDKKAVVNAMVYNIKAEFCDLYLSADLQEVISVEAIDAAVLNQVEKENIGIFYAAKGETPFKITINWLRETVLVESDTLGEKQDITFYTYRALEVCNNFAIYSLEASE
jgi:hypothetical protein